VNGDRGVVVPGSQSVLKPSIRFMRVSVSCSVMVNA